MRVLLWSYGPRGDVEPLVALALRLRELGAEVRMCAPPDYVERLAEVGVPLVSLGPPVRSLMYGATPPSVADEPRLAAELIAEQFDKLPAAAEGCDAMVATGLFPVAASAQTVAEKLGIRYAFAAYCPIFLPSPHRRPQPLPGRPAGLRAAAGSGGWWGRDGVRSWRPVVEQAQVHRAPGSAGAGLAAGCLEDGRGSGAGVWGGRVPQPGWAVGGVASGCRGVSGHRVRGSA